MEEEFKNWLKIEGKQDSTRSNYAIHLRNHIPNFLKEINIHVNNLFTIMSTEQLNELLKYFQKNGKLYTKNTEQGSFPSAAIKKYINFLESKNIKEKFEIESNDESIMPLNQILYGPPGTGKTYNTIDKALQIIDGEVPESREEAKERFEALKEAGLIAFVTFHQSYGYEEFVEGIRAKTTDRGIEYNIEAGVFKDLCMKSMQTNAIDKDTIKFNDYIQEGDKFNTLTGIEFEIINVDEKIKIKNSNQQEVSLSRKSILDYLEAQDFDNTRGHYSYQPIIAKKIFEQLKENQFTNNSNKNYILIIDEINRGNISKIFGELITLIEPSKRIGEDEEIQLRLPYSNELFGVPSGKG